MYIGKVCKKVIHEDPFQSTTLGYTHNDTSLLVIPGGACRQPPFSDLGYENGLNRLYFVCTRLYTSFFVCTPLTFLPLLGGAGDMLSPFSDFGFKNGLSRLYFVCTWLYTAFFVCTPHTFLPLQGGLGTLLHFFDFRFKNGLNRLYFVSTWLYTSFFVCTPLRYFFFYLFVKGLGTCYPLLFWFWVWK